VPPIGLPSDFETTVRLILRAVAPLLVWLPALVAALSREVIDYRHHAQSGLFSAKIRH
jgi:hypothetical protein